MKIHHVLIPLALFITPIISCGPNLDAVDLSGCMKSCNTTAKQCLDEKELEFAKCAVGDALCQRRTMKETELCLTSCLDCIAICVSVMEDQLSK